MISTPVTRRAQKLRADTHALVLQAGVEGVTTTNIANALRIPYSSARQYLRDLVAAGTVTRRTTVAALGKGQIIQIRWYSAQLAPRSEYTG
jgi:predicted ArsR family transcriptional regulator